MDTRHFSRIDLNLLITLQVLLEEGSVSATADRLFLTQPAISKSLARMREIFADPLFTRSGRGLVPTPFTEGLRESLERILTDIDGLFVAESFEPATYQGSFGFAVNEFLDMALMPMLIGELSRLAPGMHLETYTQLDNQLVALEKGDLDFVLNLKFSEIPPGFHSDLLIRDKPELFARKGHPLFRKARLGFADVVRFPRVTLNMPDMSKLSVFSTGRAAANRLDWESPFETENLMTALAVISRTDYLLPGPGLLQHFSTKDLVFKALPLKLGADVQVDYCLVTHDRVIDSQPHQWLRRKIIELAAHLEL